MVELVAQPDQLEVVRRALEPLVLGPVVGEIEGRTALSSAVSVGNS